MTKIIALTDRALLKISGDEASDFLQGLITNDINLLESQKILFTALLTPQGKFLYDFFIYKIEKDYFLDVHQDAIAGLEKKLKIYKLRREIEIVRNDDYQIYAILGADNNFDFDPRKKELGCRVLLTKEEFESLKENYQQEDLEEYNHHRIDLVIPDGVYDLTQDKSFILHFGYDKLNAISFTKGCYVGQEVTTRTYRRGVIRKHLVKLVSSTTVQKGDKIAEDGMEGVVTSFYKHQEKYIALALVTK